MLSAKQQHEFEAAEHFVELRSKQLKKELRLRDLVAIQILFIVGTTWIGTAAKLGPQHIMFWLLAVLLFYIPSGMVVAHLAAEMPLEGGLYQWAKLRFGGLVGFLVAGNIWFSNIFLVSLLGIQTADSVAYAFGPRSAWMANSKWCISLASVIVVCLLALVAWRGLSLGKWVNAVGSFGLVFLFACVIGVGLLRWFHGKAAAAPVAFTLPALTLFNLNILGKMGFGAFSGCDAVAVFAGEVRDKRVGASLRRSVLVAAPIIAAIFILGTASVLVFVAPGSVDLVAPSVQVLALGAPPLKAVASLGLVLILLAGTSLCYSVITRLPMVAGWDHLLPAYLSRLHPRYRTPTGSVVAIALVALIGAVFANFGTGNQEAYQILQNAGGILFALTYLVMFAIPLVAPGEKPSVGLRIAAASGFLMTLLYVVLSVFPIVAVANAGQFTEKVGGTVVALQIAGALHYWFAEKRRALLS